MNKKINEKCKLEKMDVEEFRKYGKEVIDYICQYGTNIEERDVAPTLDPGYLKNCYQVSMQWEEVWKNQRPGKS